MLALPPVTLTLLILNVIIGIYTMNVNPALISRMAFRPYFFYHEREVLPIITAGFAHAGLGHLFVNMFTLFFFGPWLEYSIGPGAFIAVYFGSMIIAHLATVARFKDDRNYSAVGASGAISGILFSFCLFRPWDMLYIMGIIPMPALLFAVGYVGYSIYAAKQAADNVAHEAHLGGAIGGIIITLIVAPYAGGEFLRQIGLL